MLAPGKNLRPRQLGLGIADQGVAADPDHVGGGPALGPRAHQG